MGRCKDCVASLLGVCRGDFCYTERVFLEERAQRTATQLGHDLDDFAKIERQPIWSSQCKRCWLRVTITVDPEPGQPDISGDAVSVTCSAPDRASESPLSKDAAR